jgi:hypothetical protein
MNKVVRCAECECTPTECGKGATNGEIKCLNCNKDDSCCCLSIHVTKEKRCCTDLDCKNIIKLSSGEHFRHVNDLSTASSSLRNKHQDNFGLRLFFIYAKGLYAAALGIEILCIAAADIGENTGLYLFGFNSVGIFIAYVMGYSLAEFTTFVTILGRYGNYSSNEKDTRTTEIDSCCSVLEQDSSRGFLSNIKTTFMNFAFGFKRLLRIREQRGLKLILKSSLVILVTAESACILTAETVDLIFYQYSILLSVPLALMAGAFTVVAPVAYRKAKSSAANVRTSTTI